MSKLAEIIKTGQAPGFNTKSLDERDVDRATPRALKSLNTKDENKLIKESGFSANHIKRTWGLLLLGCLFLNWELPAQDINPGYVFTPTDRVTATKLNNLVNLATINPTFISGKPSATPQASDNFVFYRSGVLYRTPFASMGVNSTNLITDQLENTTPALDDYLLTLDTSVGEYRKTQLNSLVMTNFNLIMGRTSATTPDQDSYYVLGQDATTGAFSKISRSNYFYNAFNFVQWTNLARYALGDTVGQTIPMHDNATGTNYQTSFDGLISLTPVYTTNDLADYVLIMTNGVVARMTFQSLSNTVVRGAQASKFTCQTPAAGITAPGSVTNTAHGLPGKPTILRASLVCTTANGGYSIGDEVDLVGAPRQPVANVYIAPGTVWANATSIGFTAFGTFADINIANKSTGAAVVITTADWDLRISALYQP